MGAEIVAAGRNLDPGELPWRPARALALATSQRLAHLVGVNGFFCALARAARRNPGTQLLDWWSEARCVAEWDGLIRPDGYGRWREGAEEVAFFLEYDRGTEALRVVKDKLDAYAEL